MPFDIELILRLLLSAFLGAIIGADRARMQRSAGLRTHALVSTSSSLLMIVSTYGFTAAINPGHIVLDPSRIAAQVVSGIGFLGAGIIIFRRNTVRGLTTAASVWAVAAIGLAVGAGLYAVSIAATLILSFILTALKRVEKMLFPRRNATTLIVELNSDIINATTDKIKQSGLKITAMEVKIIRGSNSKIKLDLMGEEKTFASLIQGLQTTSSIKSISYSGRILPSGDWALDDLEEEDNSDSLQ